MFATHTALLLSLLSGLPSLAQDLTCPEGSPDRGPVDFYIIGAAGGASMAACENTAEATRMGIKYGINAVELDISMSWDKVLFLWNDPVAMDLGSFSRSLGFFVNGMCHPVFRAPLRGSAGNQVFSSIKDNFGYVNASGVDQEAVIPTLHEWMVEFQDATELTMIILDIKVDDVSEADYIVGHIMDKANELGMASKVRMVSSSFDMAAALQTSLARKYENMDIASRQWGNAVVEVHLGSASDFDGVMEATNGCYGIASVGQSVSSNGWREYQKLIKDMVETRANMTKYIPVFPRTINTVEKMAWLICADVDGMYTNDPMQLYTMVQRKANGHIECCERDIVLPCLMQTDARLTGQGCSTYGLSWSDQEVTSCPLHPLDFLHWGVQLTCRQSSFAC